MGDQVQLVNPAYETSLALKQLLIEQDLLNQGSVEVRNFHTVSM